MKLLLILVLALSLSACAATITIEITDPVTKNLITKVNYNSARRALIQIDGTKINIVTGEVVISAETVKVLAPVVTSIIKPDIP